MRAATQVNTFASVVVAVYFATKDAILTGREFSWWERRA